MVTESGRSVADALKELRPLTPEILRTVMSVVSSEPENRCQPDLSED